MAKPPLELHAIVRKPDGRVFRHGANDRRADQRLMNVECGSKLMEGFADASYELARKPGVPYPDLSIYDDLTLEGLDGQIAWQGRGDAFPADVSEDQQRIGVKGAGWMTHARDRPCPALLYVDRDLNHWSTVSRVRRNAWIAAAREFVDGIVDSDVTSGISAVSFNVAGNASTTQQVGEMLYYAAGAYIGSIYYDFVRGTNVTSSYEAYVGSGPSADAPLSAITANLCLSAGSAGTYAAAVGDRAAGVNFRTPSGDGGTDGLSHDVNFRRLAVFGTQGLTKYGTAPNEGYLVGDLIRDSGTRFAPLLDYSQIPVTAFVVQQAAYLEDLVDPYDFWLDLNKYEQRHLAVWENRQLTYDEFDYDTVDWRVRTDEPGVKVRHAGPSTGRVANGVIVRYQDVSTLRSTVITPDDNALLADTDPNIEANKHGVDAWVKIQLPDPDSADGAVRYGQKALARLNKQQAPTRITVRGHIRDYAHHWHQGWRPRAAETVLIEDEEDGRPRLIHEPRWNAQTKTLTMSCDASSESIDAILDELITEAKMARSG